MYHELVYAGLVLLSSVFALVVGAWLWADDADLPTRLFAIMILLHPLIGVLVIAELFAPGRSAAVVLYGLHSAVSVPITPVWFLFAAAYTKRTRWLSRPVVLVILGWTAALAVLEATNPIHGLIWSDYAVAPAPFPYLEGVQSGLFEVLTVPQPLLYFAGMGILGYYFLSESRVSRLQTLALFVGFLPPLVVYTAWQLGRLPGPLNGAFMIGSMWSLVIVGWAVFRYQLFDLVPLARETVFEDIADPVIVVDRQRRLLDYNLAATRVFPELTGAEGTPLGELLPALVSGEDEGGFAETFRYGEDEPRDFEVTVSPLTVNETTHGYGLIARDVTERLRYERQLQSLQGASVELVSATTEQEIAQTAVDIVDEVLDRELAAVWTRDPSKNELTPIAVNAAGRRFMEEHGVDQPMTVAEGSIGMTAYRSGELRVVEDFRSRDDAIVPLPLGSLMLAPLGDYGLLAAGSTGTRQVTATDRSLIDILARELTANLQRTKREQATERLHDATREMLSATDPSDVCETATGAARDVLGFSAAGIWLADETGTLLEPVASTEAARELHGELPTFTEEDDRVWRAFEEGETRAYKTGETGSGPGTSTEPTGSELIVPLGDYGVMVAGAKEEDVFDEDDVTIARLLGANTAAALDRVERERDLEQLTDQMEFFNSILRHDVLNGMTVIRGRAQFLADDLDGDQLRYADMILDWSDDIVEVVRHVRAVLDALTGKGGLRAEPIELTAVLEREVERVRETYPAVSFEVSTPDSVRIRANELLGEVLGNVITNAVDHNDADGLRIRIGVERNGDAAVVRIADNGRGVPDDRKEAIFRRDETGHAKSSGSGFGLFFVDTMVAEYGGDVRIEDNDAGGATFVIELPEATAP